MNLRKKENLSLLCQPTQIISSLIYPSCQEKTQNFNQKKSYEAAARDEITGSCGWGMREVAVDSLCVSPFGQCFSQGPGRKQMAPSKVGKKASLMKALFTKVWKDLREFSKKMAKHLGLETLELEAAHSWGFREETQSYPNHCQQRKSWGISTHLSSYALNSSHCL